MDQEISQFERCFMGIIRHVASNHDFQKDIHSKKEAEKLKIIN